MSAPASLPENYFAHTLSNGLRLVGQRMPSLASITLGIQLPAGIQHEPAEQLGLTYLLSDVIFQGTKTRNVRRLTEDFEEIGARRGGEAGVEFARYSAQIVGTKLDRALELMADVIRNPTFPDTEFEQMRAVQLQDIRRRDDEPMRRIFDLVREKFYAGTSLGRRAMGTTDSVSALTAVNLRDFYAAHYHPEGSLFAIAGNFDWDDVVRRVESYFGDWQGAGPAAPVETPTPASSVEIELVDGNQEHIGMAYPFVKYGDPDYYAANVMIEIFGGGMSSRLFREVREKRGLVYSVAAMFAPNGTYGAGYIYAGTTPEKAHETVQVVLGEMRALERDGVTADELERAKVQLKSELVMRAESSGARMGALCRSWWFEGRAIPIHEIATAIDAVTQEQILGLLKRFPLTQTLVIGAIGPREREELIGDALTPAGG